MHDLFIKMQFTAYRKTLERYQIAIFVSTEAEPDLAIQCDQSTDVATSAQLNPLKTKLV
jgi:hypothetical protein